jgi:hypothetical protein
MMGGRVFAPADGSGCGLIPNSQWFSRYPGFNVWAARSLDKTVEKGWAAFAKAYQTAELDERVGAWSKLSNAELVRIAMGGQPATPVFAVAAVSVTRAHVGFNAPSHQSNARTGRYGLALS